MAQDSPQEGMGNAGYVFLIDVSGSMSGEAGHLNIFPEVKRSLTQFVRQLDPGTMVLILPFDEQIHGERQFIVPPSRDVSAIESYIDGLSAAGQRTGVYNSIASALQRVTDWRKATGAEYPVVFYVYTDGDDNVGHWSLDGILSHFALQRGRDDWLFYVKLGVPLKQGEKEAFGKNRGTVIISEPPGTLPTVVEPLVRPLVFGNLKLNPTASLVEIFAVRSGEKPPPGVMVRVEVAFESVSAQGGLVRVSPSQFRFADSVNLELSLVNAGSVSDGTYTGRLTYISSDPGVRIVPSDIRASFRFDEGVSVRPAEGASFPLDFGRVKAPKSGGVEVRRRDLLLSFGAAATSANEPLKFRLMQGEANPGPLVFDRQLMIEGLPGEQGAIGPGTDRLSVVLRVDSTFRSGRYTGAIRFQADQSVVRLSPGGSEDSAGMVSWVFVVPRPPIPFWVWALVAALMSGAAAMTVRQLRRPPVFADLKLVLLEPERREIDLAGRSSVGFGEGGEEIQAAAVAFHVLAKKEKGHVWARVQVDDGQVMLKKIGTREESAVVGEEDIFDGDVLSFGEYRLRVSSFSLTRE